MWPALSIRVVFIETPINYRYTSQKPCIFLLLFIYPLTVGIFPWFEIFFPDFGWKTFCFFPWFPWLEKVFKIFPDQWEPRVLLKSHLLKKPFAHVLPKVSKTLLPPFKAFSTIPHLYADSLYWEKSGSQLVLDCDRRQQLLLLLGRPRLYFVQYRMRLQQKQNKKYLQCYSQSRWPQGSRLFHDLTGTIPSFHHSIPEAGNGRTVSEGRSCHLYFLPFCKEWPVAKEPAALWIALLGTVHCERG